MIRFNVFKGGTDHIVTMSYDDSQESDKRLISLFDKYGVKGTFNVNTDGNDIRIAPEEFAEVYKNHEVAVHTVTHPFLELVPISTQIREITENRKCIEQATGKLARGMAYPFGTYKDEVINTAKACGICYSRTTGNTMGFVFPQDFMKWHPTCHHRDAAPLADKFVNELDISWRCNLFYIWGHSFEFRTEEDWAYMERVLEKISGHKNVWYATNIEIYDYIKAQHDLQISADEKIIHNPSAIDVWFTKDGKKHMVKAGETITF